MASQSALKRSHEVEESGKFGCDGALHEDLQEVVEKLEKEKKRETRTLVAELGVPGLFAVYSESVESGGEASVEPAPSLS